MGDVGSGEVDLTKVDFTDRGLSLLGRLADAIRAISREHSVFLKNPYHTTDTEMEYNAENGTKFYVKRYFEKIVAIEGHIAQLLIFARDKRFSSILHQPLTVVLAPPTAANVSIDLVRTRCLLLERMAKPAEDDETATEAYKSEVAVLDSKILEAETSTSFALGSEVRFSQHPTKEWNAVVHAECVLLAYLIEHQLLLHVFNYFAVTKLCYSCDTYFGAFNHQCSGIGLVPVRLRADYGLKLDFPWGQPVLSEAGEILEPLSVAVIDEMDRTILDKIDVFMARLMKAKGISTAEEPLSELDRILSAFKSPLQRG